MARNHDRNRVRSVGQPHGAAGVWISDTAGEFAVRNCLAIWDLAKLCPDSLLKASALWRKRKIEGFEFPREIGAKLTDSVRENECVMTPVAVNRSRPAILREINLPQ